MSDMAVEPEVQRAALEKMELRLDSKAPRHRRGSDRQGLLSDLVEKEVDDLGRNASAPMESRSSRILCQSIMVRPPDIEHGRTVKPALSKR